MRAFADRHAEGIATEIEQPFGRQPSDLPLDLITAEVRPARCAGLASPPTSPPINLPSGIPR